MSDDLLARAKFLINAANGISNITMLPSIQNHSTDVNIVSSPSPKKIKQNSMVSPPISDDAGGQFKGAAFNGSALITTYKDCRKLAPRGSYFIVDGNKVKVSTEGEWNANRITLTEDYKGETNLDACIAACTATKSNVNKRKKAPNAAVPIPTGELSSALSGLEDVQEYVNSVQNKTNSSSTKQGKAGKPYKQNQKTNNLKINKRTIVPKIEHFDEATRAFDDIQKPQPLEIVDNDQIRSVEELNMLQELDSLAPEDLEQRKIDMNDRLVRKGVSRAIERVEVFKQRKNENLHSPDSYLAKMQLTIQGDHENVPSYVERQRQAAAIRVKMQRKMEDEAILRKLDEDAQKEKAYKEKMEQKAEQLRKRTEERVAELKRAKRLAALEEKRKADALVAEKKARMEDEDLIADRMQRIEQMRNETEKRLKKRALKKEQLQKNDKNQYEWKLKQIASVRQRELPTLAYIHTNNLALKKAQDDSVTSQGLLTSHDAMKGLLPPIAMRSKSEHSVHRTPRKDSAKEQKQTKVRKASHRAPASTSPITVDQISDDDRVVIETIANNGVSLPAAASQEAQALQLQEQKRRSANAEQYSNKLNSKFEEVNAEYQLRQQQNEQSVPHNVLKSTLNNPSNNPLNRYDDGDDDFDDFDVDDDSLGGCEKIEKDFSKPYQDDIVMGYDEEVPISSARPPIGAKSSNSLSSMKSGGRGSRIPLPVRDAVPSRHIPRSIVNSNISGTEGQTTTHLVHQNAIVSHHSRDDDDISDISVEGLRSVRNASSSTLSNNDTQKEYHSDQKHLTNKSQVSASDTSAKRSKTKKRTKEPVWKMAPIPVRPYVAVPN